MRLYLSRIEGPPPKRNAARSTRARRAKPIMQQTLLATLCCITGFLFLESDSVVYFLNICVNKQKLNGEDTRFLPGEESCKEAIWRCSLSA